MSQKTYREAFRDTESDTDNIFEHMGEFGPFEGFNIKLERDLIRQRDWDYSVFAVGLEPKKQEELRGRVIERYGEELELLSTDGGIDSYE